MKQNKLVTKEYLLKQLEIDPVKLVGRALVAIFNNQVSQEQAGNTTVLKNGIGFTQSDARLGSIAAKTYLKNKTLEPWQLKVWTSLNKKGQPRIVKYADQLNAIAIKKKAIKVDYTTSENSVLSDYDKLVKKVMNDSNPNHADYSKLSYDDRDSWMEKFHPNFGL